MSASSTSSTFIAANSLASTTESTTDCGHDPHCNGQCGTMPRVRIAVVDLGTNSTRLLVADVERGRVRQIERRTNVTRLGEGVDSSGRLAPAAVERVLDAVAEYRRVIDELGASRAIGIATSAVRDSGNGEEFRAAVRDRYGIDTRILSGDEEARLTFLGATAARPPGQPTLV